MPARTLAIAAILAAVARPTVVYCDGDLSPAQTTQKQQTTQGTEPTSDVTNRGAQDPLPPIKSPSCHDHCQAEGFDADECDQECNWVVQSKGKNLDFTASQYQRTLARQESF